MQEKIDISVRSFYVFNPSFGSKEGQEDKKIFYFYPPKTDIAARIKTVGLSEAIIKFIQTFATNEDFRSVHTLKTRQYFYNPEPDYWMVLTINVPHTKSKTDAKDMYHSDNIHDEVYLSVLKQSYDMYKLFVGSFHSLLDESRNTRNLMMKLQEFFNKYVHHMNVADYDIIDVFEGIQFLPLDKKTYLHAQSFMNQFHGEFFDHVQYSALLVKNHVVWSNIDSTELRVIYRYLVANLLAPYIADDSNKDTLGDISNEINVINDTNIGCFIACPMFYTNNTLKKEKVPELIIRNGDNIQIYQLVVYTVLSSFMCIFVPKNLDLSLDFLKTIETFLKRKLTALASELSLQIDKRRSARSTSSTRTSFSYIYFNRLNLAQKNTLRDNKNNFPSEVLSVLTDICFDKKKNELNCETIVKTYDDYWVIGQICNEREFYVVTQHKSSTLIEISDEMRKICDKQLKSIFFHV